MVELKKTAGTLDELVAREDEIKAEIKVLSKEKGRIHGTIKSFQKLIASVPKPARKKSRKKSAVAASA